VAGYYSLWHVGIGAKWSFPVPVGGVTAGNSMVDAPQGEVHGGPGVSQPLKSEDDVVTELVHDQEGDILVGLISDVQAGVEGAGSLDGRSLAG
jgi:hypothetical protein